MILIFIFQKVWFFSVATKKHIDQTWFDFLCCNFIFTYWSTYCHRMALDKWGLSARILLDTNQHNLVRRKASCWNVWMSEQCVCFEKAAKKSSQTQNREMWRLREAERHHADGRFSLTASSCRRRSAEGDQTNGQTNHSQYICSWPQPL